MICQLRAMVVLILVFLGFICRFLGVCAHNTFLLCDIETGHGARVRDDDWDEEQDGFDETLVPADYASAGQIRDDDLYDSLVCAMPEGVHLVSLMDCCHSGTVLDLPYTYRANGESSNNGMSYDPNKLEHSGSPGMGGGGLRHAAIVIGVCIAIALVIALPIMLT